MSQALIAISMILQVVFVISLVRLIFHSQRASAKKWLKLSGWAFLVSIAALSFVMMRQLDDEAVALGFQDSADHQKAQAEGILDPAVWRVRKAELAAEAAKLRKEEERKAEIQEAAAAERKATEVKLAAWKEKNCDKDLDCIGMKKMATANAFCSMAVEQLAKYQSEWSDSFGERKFPYYRWGNRAGVVTYYGGAIKFQNGFGAWQNMVYECDFDIRRDQPIDVRAEAGRLR
ncbi:hypothetical protein [Chenggangzhangella methanolivorans]|uniref:Uncharacterized protein n=1 Tax=Chenggangzhangella methanolivorans TaxID=1437009 RepID=A0A9E6RDD6_9HYPH|nr:hypothetical protein [Chenggangzhangella methanolivorans]QZO01254.1 hypothetical protein K6K41_06935 [Chenggangzhangella methanolivorans]